MSSRWANWLNLITPRSGRLVAEDGSFINQASIEQERQRYSVTHQTVANGAAILSSRNDAVNVTSYYFGIDIPDGRQFVLFNRELHITEGDFNIDVVSAANGFSGGTAGSKGQLAAGSTQTVQTVLYGGVTPSGAITVQDVDIIDTGTSLGSGRSGGATGVDGVVRILRGQSMLRVTRLSADPYRVAIRLICWEEDIT